MPSTILSDNGVTSGTAGIKTTGSNDGQLALQTTTAGGAATTALEINTSQQVSFTAGTAAAPAITPTGDTNTGIFFPAADTIAFAEGGAEAMRIDSSGNVLLNTTTSRTAWDNGTIGSNLLQVERSGEGNNTSISIANNGGTSSDGSILYLGRSRGTANNSYTAVASSDKLGKISFQGADGTEFVEAAAISGVVDGTSGANDMPGRLSFSVTRDGESSTTERARILNTGSFRTFAVNNCVVISDSTAAGTGSWLIEGRNSATAVNTGTACFDVLANGNVRNTNNSYGSLSDIKLKENIVDAGSQWADLKSFRIRKYNFKEETNHQTHTQIGLIAQEAELISPGLIYETPDRDNEGNDLGTVTKSINYSVLYMKAVKALQEAMERIEALEARLAALEGRA